MGANKDGKPGEVTPRIKTFEICQCTAIASTRLCNILQISIVVKKDKFPMQKMRYFSFFAQNIDYGYTEAVLTSTHNLCFRANIRRMYTLVNTSITI